MLIKKLINIFPNKKNEKGVAILMVMTSLTILTFILAEFSYETSVNRIRVYNYQDKLQARLNAEAGLNFAMARFKIYKEAKVKFGTNATPEQLNQILMEPNPIMFPVPLPKKADIIQKTALANFEKELLLEGKMMLTISPVRGLLNPNNLRLRLVRTSLKNAPKLQEDADKFLEETEKEFTKLLESIIESKKESDEDFASEYADINPALLVKEIKFYVSDKGSIDDPDMMEIESEYNSKEITPKYDKMSSISEMYNLVGWDDAIIDLIKKQITVHTSRVISLNELTDKDLKMIFPTVSEEQTKKFFEHRDGSTSDVGASQDPKPFKEVKEFENLIVNELQIVDSSEYKDRIDFLKSIEIDLGLSSELYNVTSIGEHNRASYTINAKVLIPRKPQPPANSGNSGSSGSSNKPNNSGNSNKPSNSNKTPPVEYLDPRIIEIVVS